MVEQNLENSKSLNKLLKNKFVVGIVACFVEVKKNDRLIETFATFAIGKEALLVLCGDGPMRGTYERLILKFGLSEKVFITGFVEDIVSIQSLFDVCVVPSCGEAFGLAVIESLSLGTPVVVYADGGCATEIISPLSPDDIVEDNMQLLDRLNFYFERNTLSIEKRTERINYAGIFSIEKMKKNIYKIYKRII